MGNIFGGSKSTSTTTQTVEPATPQDLELKKVDLEFSQLNLERFKQEQRLIDEILAGGGRETLIRSAEIERELLEPRAEAARLELANVPLIAELQRLELEAAQERIPLEQKILQEQIAFIERGGLPSEEQFAQIDELLAASRELGISEIDEAVRLANKTIIEDITPSRGLRPTDTPILSELADIGEQGIRQKGRLELKLAEQRGSLALGQPLSVANFATNITAPSLNRAPALPFSSGQFVPNLQPTAPAIGSFTASRGAAATNFAPTFGPQFFVTGQSSGSARGPGLGFSVLSGFSSGLGQGIGLGLASKGD